MLPRIPNPYFPPQKGTREVLDPVPFGRLDDDDSARMRRLIELTERPQALADALRKRGETSGISITIGTEHDDERLRDFTVVTAEYRAGSLTGVIGVIGPTRMPYEKVISLVNHTSQLLSELLD